MRDLTVFFQSRARRRARAEATTKLIREAAATYDGAVKEAIAEGHSEVPKGARCYICLEEGDLIRGCACRGPDAGVVHLSCLVALAEAKRDDEDYFKSLSSCGQCKQRFQGAANIALKRAAWLRYCGRPETDEQRQLALSNLGVALYNEGRLEECVLIEEQCVETARRLDGPNAQWTICCEERLAITMRHHGGPEHLGRTLEILQRAHAWKVSRLGRDHEDTLATAGHLAYAMSESGRLEESEALRRETLAKMRRVLGEDHSSTLECKCFLAQALARSGKEDEARALHAELLPTVDRVLGPKHKYARLLRSASFFADKKRLAPLALSTKVTGTTSLFRARLRRLFSSKA